MPQEKFQYLITINYSLQNLNLLKISRIIIKHVDLKWLNPLVEYIKKQMARNLNSTVIFHIINKYIQPAPISIKNWQPDSIQWNKCFE